MYSGNVTLVSPENGRQLQLSSELVRCGNKDDIKAFLSLTFFFSFLLFFTLRHLFSPCLQVSIHPLLSHFHHLLSSLCFCLWHSHFSHPLLFILRLVPSGQDHVGSYVHEDKSVCCIPNCSQQPPRTNKAYLLLWPSLESKWIDGYILPGRIFFFSLSLLYGGRLSRRSSSVICCPWRMKMCEVGRVQGQLRTQAAAGRGGDRKHNCKKQKLNESNSSCTNNFKIRW